MMVLDFEQECQQTTSCQETFFPSTQHSLDCEQQSNIVVTAFVACVGRVVAIDDSQNVREVTGYNDLSECKMITSKVAFPYDVFSDTGPSLYSHSYTNSRKVRHHERQLFQSHRIILIHSTNAAARSDTCFGSSGSQQGSS